MTKPEIKSMLEQLKLDEEVRYLKFQDDIDKIMAYVDGSEDKAAEMDKQIKDKEKE